MKFSFRKNKVWVAILVVFIVIFLLNLTQKEVRGFLYYISSPIQKVFWRMGDKVTDFFGAIFNIKNLKEERDELELKNQELLSRLSLLQELKEENKILREALEIELQKEFNLVFAQVISKDISQDSILIDKGATDRISKNMPVITQQKVLVGRVSEVYVKLSKVMLISNKESSFDAKILNKEEEEDSEDISGVVRGEGNFKILFDLLPKEKEINQGDIIVTSALGGIFPKGLLVGEIQEVIKNDVEPFQQARIKPALNIKEIEGLFIITNF